MKMKMKMIVMIINISITVIIYILSMSISMIIYKHPRNHLGSKTHLVISFILLQIFLFYLLDFVFVFGFSRVLSDGGTFKFERIYIISNSNLHILGDAF